jgi:hypothetical protein
MRATVTTIVLVFTLSVVSRVEAKAWRGIIPLQTTRAAVVQILGKGTDSKSAGTKYNFENENVSILYSSNDNALEECTRKLPPDLVLAIYVFPKVEVSLETLGLTRDSMKTLPTLSDSLPTTAFADDDEGLVMSESGGIQEIAYLPSKAERARCPDFYGDLSTFVIRRFICILCPTVSVDCPEENEAGNKITFTSRVTVGTPALELSFNWTVDQGTIVEGQGTARIRIDTTNLAGKTITATVDVNGIDPSCPKTASCSTPIVKHRKKSHN